MPTDKPTVRIAAMTLIALLAAAACTSAPQPARDNAVDDSEPAATGPPEGIHDVSEFQRFRVRASAQGAATFTHDGVHDVHITHVGGLGLNTNVLSMGLTVPVKLDDPAERFRWGFDVLHLYGGPGRYEFDARADQGLRNIVELVYLRAKDPTADALYEPDEAEEFLTFHDIRRPCTLEAREPGYSGTLTCPEVAADDGQTISFTISWDPPE